MKTTKSRLVKSLALAGWVALPIPLLANYLDNTDFKSGLAAWHGDGETAFLKPDGTEGAEGDAGSIPVLKIKASRGHSVSAYQEFDTRDNPSTMHVKVDVFASSDFLRSIFASDYTKEWKAGGTWYWSAIVIPTTDFWIRGGPHSFYKLIDVKPGNWVTLDGHFQGLDPADSHTMNFCVAPGEGTVYLKNPVVEP
jgi:hypothetical protein